MTNIAEKIEDQLIQIGVDAYDFDEVISCIEANETDFEVGDYRFISNGSIDSIQEQELGQDLYILGAFNADFLSGIIGISSDAIAKFQESDANEGVGEIIVSGGHLSEVQQQYSSCDGYGHHFAHYDGDEHEISWKSQDGESNLLYCFKVN